MACRRGGSADLRIVLLGKTGAGKSSTGNAILGMELFKPSGEVDTKTSKCVAKTKTVDGRRITVVDTPGYCWVSDEERKPEIAKCIRKCFPGPHAFLIVLTVGSQTREEQKVVEDILKMFGEEALKYAVVLLTHGDELNDKTIQQFVDKNMHLKTLVQKCGNRLHVIDNNNWNNPIAGRGDEIRISKGIENLLNIIDQMVTWNRGKHYTNVMLQAAARAIEQERVNIRKEIGRRLPEIIVNEMAKENVRTNFLFQAADDSTGFVMSEFVGGNLTKLINVPTSSDAAAAAGARSEGVAEASADTGIGLGAEGVAVPSAATGIGLGAEGVAVASAATGIELGAEGVAVASADTGIGLGAEGVAAASAATGIGLGAENVAAASAATGIGLGAEGVAASSAATEIGLGAENVAAASADTGIGLGAENVAAASAATGIGLGAEGVAAASAVTGIGLGAEDVAAASAATGIGLGAEGVAAASADTEIGLGAEDIAAASADTGIGLEAEGVAAVSAVTVIGLGAEGVTVVSADTGIGLGAEGVTVASADTGIGLGAEGVAVASAATGIGLGAAFDQMVKQNGGKLYTKAVAQATEADLRIVLLGKTGAGKSSAGNTILREKLFTTSCSGNSGTAICEAETKTVNGRKITVIDTPGYCCTVCPDEKLKPEIVKCIIECSPGPHAFLIVLSVGRQTQEEQKVVEDILKMFGEEALKYAVVLFTSGDQLDDDKTIHQFVDENRHLKRLVQKCGDRLHVIDNKHWNNLIAGCGDETRNSKEIKSLLNTIDQMVEQNGYYTNEMLQSVEQAIEEEKDNIRKETGGQLLEIKVKEKAKENVRGRFLIQAAGVSTGTLMGALFGVVVCVGAAVALVSTAGIAAGVVVAIGACGGGIAGGIAGKKASKKAKTPEEAAKGAVKAVAKPAKNILKKRLNM